MKIAMLKSLTHQVRVEWLIISKKVKYEHSQAKSKNTGGEDLKDILVGLEICCVSRNNQAAHCEALAGG